MRERVDGMDLVGRFFEGTTPIAKPRVTTMAAAITFGTGIFRVCTLETRIVSGRTRPRAIWKGVV